MNSSFFHSDAFYIATASILCGAIIGGLIVFRIMQRRHISGTNHLRNAAERMRHSIVEYDQYSRIIRLPACQNPYESFRGQPPLTESEIARF